MKRITYGSLAAGLAIVILGVSLSACALIQPLVGETASEQTRTYAEYVFEGFKRVWIPALAAYRNRDKCGPGVKAPCYEERLYKPMHVATDAATACMVASTAPGIPLYELETCLAKVNEAKLTFTQNGLTPKGAPL
jgi:hypothetical protein